MGSSFLQSSVSSDFLLLGFWGDFDIRECPNARKQSSRMLTAKSMPEVWKTESSMAFPFCFIFSSGFQDVLWDKLIWDLFWCGLDPAPVWTEMSAACTGQADPGEPELAQSQNEDTRSESTVCVAPLHLSAKGRVCPSALPF